MLLFLISSYYSAAQRALLGGRQQSESCQEGGAVQRVWMQAVLDSKHENDKEQILADLIDYCRLDTLAMVEIYYKLKVI